MNTQAVAAANDRYSDRANDDWHELMDAVDNFDWSDEAAIDDVREALFDIVTPEWLEAQYTQQTAIGAIVRNAVNERALQMERDRCEEGRAGL